MNSANLARLLACQNEIVNRLRDSVKNVDSNTVTATAYLLAQAAEYNYPFGVELHVVINNAKCSGIDLSYMVDFVGEHTWNNLKKLCSEYCTDDFMGVAALPTLNADKRDDFETPACVGRLAARLLKVAEHEKVADFCCGYGGVAIELAQERLVTPVTGIEIKERAATIAKIRTVATGSNVDIAVGDVFEYIDASKKFDKIFCNYPFGLHLRELGPRHEYLQRISKQVPSVSKATSSDWVFNHLLIDSLNAGGKAIGIMTNGSTWNTIDRSTREYFVTQGYIESIIALPEKLFASTSIPTTMIVLSHGNDKIRMIDATNICKKGRRQNLLTEENIDRIISACTEDSEISRVLTIEDLRESGFVLHPDRYFSVEVDEGISFESVIKNIGRGAHCTAEQLDAMSTRDETNIHFLKNSDIQDGIIVGPMQCLSYIEGNFEKYCIKNNSLVISKIGFPYKVAIVTVTDEEKILANANLYVVELDERKVDPYYLRAFLESEEGQSRFKSITVGASVPSMGVKDLKAMRIPLPPMEEQKRIGQQCKAVLDEISLLKDQLESAKRRLAHVISE